MKLRILFLFIGALALASCGGNNTHSHDGETHSHADGEEAHSHDGEAATMENAAPHGEGKEYTSAYVCPMHCEGSGSEQPGNCPVCGMDYVALAGHTQDGHSH